MNNLRFRVGQVIYVPCKVKGYRRGEDTLLIEILGDNGKTDARVKTSIVEFIGNNGFLISKVNSILDEEGCVSFFVKDYSRISTPRREILTPQDNVYSNLTEGYDFA